MATTRNLIPPLQEKEEQPFEAARTIPRQVQGVIEISAWDKRKTIRKKDSEEDP